MKSIKVCLVGPSFTGKSTLVNYLHDKPSACVETTIGVAYSCMTLENTKLHIWDTAGQEKYAPLTPMYYRNADICICMFDASRVETFERLENEIITNISPNTKCIILGNKIDKITDIPNIRTTLDIIYVSILQNKYMNTFMDVFRTHVSNIESCKEQDIQPIESMNCCY